LFAPACFLCRSEDAEIFRSLSFEEILTVWRLVGLDLSGQALAELKIVGKIHLYRCRRCGFRFFDPRLAGDDSFYSALHSHVPGYYAPSRPENERNARFARQLGLQSILDVGCGTGSALNVARAEGLQTYGLELTPSAAQQARESGHTIFSVPLRELDPSWNGRFGMISLNQLLEHLPDPIGLLQDSVRLLSPNGVIGIAVPSSAGALRFHPWMALNWPPHHLSWWRRRDLFHLAERCEMTVISSGGNELLGRDLAEYLLGNRLYHLTLGKTYFGPGPTSIKLLSFLYRKTGMKYLFRSQGHSIFCFLQRKQ
jgi:SAM-dependent methyltransferase